jgi:arylsulfatase A-like enzyme
MTTRINRRQLLRLAGALPMAVRAALTQRPNVLVILADDCGYADFGFQRSPDFHALTPALDHLASQSVRFSNGYVTGAVCCPSRAGLLTGRYPQRFGFESNTQDFENAGLPVHERTIADHLKPLGYRTYAVGKWHLGERPEAHPNRRGFDQFFGFIGGARSYFALDRTGAETRLQRNGVTVPEQPGSYLTDRLGSEASTYLTEHTRQFAPDPFFLYLAFNAVHAPLEADAARLADPRVAAIGDPGRRTLAAMTLALDDNIGRVLRELESLGLAQNTIVAFLNDNGGPEDAVDGAPNHSDNGILRGDKQLLYEGGVRTPFLLRWPAALPDGVDVLEPAISLDLLPTFLDAAGGTPLPGGALDGVSLLHPPPGERTLFWRTAGSVRGQSAVRRGAWKMVREDAVGGGRAELYDLWRDPSEADDLVSARPDIAEALTLAHAAWEQTVIEPLWGAAAPVKLGAPLTVESSPLGYSLLASRGNQLSFAFIPQRYPLRLEEDWTLSCEVLLSEGASRNGYIAFADSQQAARTVRCGIDAGAGRLEVAEDGEGGATSSVSVQWPSGVVELAVRYRAADRSLVFSAAGSEIRHPLSGGRSRFSHLGYALRGSAMSASPIRRAGGDTPLASGFQLLSYRKDYHPGAYDVNGRFMGGTETLSLVAHQGMLFAGIGYWNDLLFGGEPSADPHPGPQVLVKRRPDADWEADFSGGAQHLRIESLASVRLTTDHRGNRLDPPVPLLLAGTGELRGSQATVYQRSDETGTWGRTEPGRTASGNSVVRVIRTHLDRITGIHHVFAGVGSRDSRIHRGGWNRQTGLLEWDSEPELRGTERVMSGGECNGLLYFCIGSNGKAGDDAGGIFYRVDGPLPRWHFVQEWDIISDRAPDIRGFTAVPHPEGKRYEVALVTLEMYGQVFRIEPVEGDPAKGHAVTMEFDIRRYFGEVWGQSGPINFPALSAYNDMPEVKDPLSGEIVNLIGVWVNHPSASGTALRNNAWYLIRRRNGSYTHAQVIDPDVLPNPPLRATRAVAQSPFAADNGRVFYLGGFDAAAPRPIWHNTAWIYRGELSGPG